MFNALVLCKENRKIFPYPKNMYKKRKNLSIWKQSDDDTSNKLNIKSNNGIDYNRINNYIINDIKLEHIKNITFDRGI